MSSLLDKFEDLNFKTEQWREPCAFELKDRPCGDQCKGVRFFKQGIFSQAGLCKCVLECKNCLGTCLRESVQANALKVSLPCRQPMPTKIVTLFNQAKIPARYVNADLENFSNFSGNGKPIVKKITDYVSAMHDSGQKGLLFSGSIGVGKTYLLVGIAKKLLERGFSVRYVDYFQLLHELRATYSQGTDKNEFELLEPFAKVDVLVVDEFAKSRGSDWELSILDQLVMTRYNSGKTLIAATNYRLQRGAGRQQEKMLEPLDQSPASKAKSQFSPVTFELLEEKVGQRIYSRIREMTEFVEIQGVDYRPIFH